MNDQQRYENVIHHWNDIIIAIEQGNDIPDHNSDECAYCKKYLLIFEDEGEFFQSCDGCPVKEATGKHLCKGTPWVSYNHIYNFILIISSPQVKQELLRDAIRERDFLLCHPPHGCEKLPSYVFNRSYK